MPPEEFAITVGRHRDTVTVSPAGELDLATVPQLREHLDAFGAEEGTASLVVDLAGLTFLDSSGIALLVAIWRRAQREGFALRIVGVGAATLRLLELCGLAELLPIGGGEDREPSR